MLTCVSFVYVCAANSQLISQHDSIANIEMEDGSWKTELWYQN